MSKKRKVSIHDILEESETNPPRKKSKSIESELLRSKKFDKFNILVSVYELYDCLCKKCV